MTKNNSHKKSIIFIINSNNIFFNKYYYHNIKAINIYNKFNFLHRRMANILYRFYPEYLNYIFRTELIKDNVDYVLFDGSCTEAILYWLKKNMPQHSRLFLWCWNPIHFNVPNNIFDGYYISTYSIRDSKKFNIYYNGPFYFDELRLPNVCSSYDIYFLGNDKGRYKRIIELEKIFKAKKLKTLFILTDTKRLNLKMWRRYSKNITYEANLNNVAQSKAILEILQDPYDGLSLRAMESLFFSKKLITNSREIMNHPFYDKHNIFILGYDDMDLLENFLKIKYHPVNPDILKSYNFDEWVMRLINHFS